MKLKSAVSKSGHTYFSHTFRRPSRPLPVAQRLGGNAPCLPKIQDGIALASMPMTMKITQESYTEDIVLDYAQVIILQGGWDADFTSNSSYTTIHGSVTISHGTMINERIMLE